MKKQQRTKKFLLSLGICSLVLFPGGVRGRSPGDLSGIQGRQLSLTVAKIHDSSAQKMRDRQQGKNKIDRMVYLTEDQKNFYKQKVDRADTYQELESILSQAEFTNRTLGKDEITIYLEWQDGSREVLQRKLIKGDSIGRLPRRERPGYEFLGWYEGNRKVREDDRFYGDRSLQGKWKSLEEKTLTITSFRAGPHRITGYTNEAYGKVFLKDGKGRLITSTTSDGRGYFDLSSLDLGKDYEVKGQGDYYLYVEKSGYKTSSRYYLATKDPQVEKVEIQWFNLYGDRVEGYTTQKDAQVTLYDNYGYSVSKTRSDQAGYFSLPFHYVNEYPYTDYHLIASKEGAGYGKKHFLRVELAKNADQWGKRFKRVHPVEGERTHYSVSGTLPEKNARISVYGKEGYLASSSTDHQGKFTLHWSRPWVAKEERLQYFLGEGRVEEQAAAPKVTKALPGTRVVEGQFVPGGKVTVFTEGPFNAGGGKADDKGYFRIDLSLNLVAGKTITLVGQEEEKLDREVTYLVEQKTEELLRKAYIFGYPDGSFRPNANVTRGEAAQMFAGLLHGSTNFGLSNITAFQDSNNSWYSQAINYVVDQGLISGYGDGRFKPNQNITRAEFAQMISGYIKSEMYGNKEFSDVKGHWAEEAIQKIYKNELVSGYPDGTFQPDREISRAEAVRILNGVFGRKTEASSIKDSTKWKTFIDVSPSFWAYYDILDGANDHRSQKDGISGEEIWLR